MRIVAVPPSAPVLYVTSSTSSSVLLHWKSENNGGAPLTGYTLYYRTAHGTLDELQLSRHATSHELKVGREREKEREPVPESNHAIINSSY